MTNRNVKTRDRQQAAWLSQSLRPEKVAIHQLDKQVTTRSTTWVFAHILAAHMATPSNLTYILQMNTIVIVLQYNFINIASTNTFFKKCATLKSIKMRMSKLFWFIFPFDFFRSVPCESKQLTSTTTTTTITTTTSMTKTVTLMTEWFDEYLTICLQLFRNRLEN